mgnify:CR=1 FL=1
MLTANPGQKAHENAIALWTAKVFMFSICIINKLEYMLTHNNFPLEQKKTGNKQTDESWNVILVWFDSLSITGTPTYINYYIKCRNRYSGGMEPELLSGSFDTDKLQLMDQSSKLLA